MRFKHLVLPTDPREPVGIVIADGGRGDRPTRFSAFVWGPVPDDEPSFAVDPRVMAGAHA
jgi:hypothetical protein